MSEIQRNLIATGGGRNLGIELLRILSMLMIVSIHYWVFCFPLNTLSPLSFEWFVGTTAKGLSQCAVNIYVLISAYYICISSFKCKRIWSVATQVLFYSISIYIILLSTRLITFSLSDFRVFFPVLFREYWFVTEYVGLMILSPFLNKLINRFSYIEYKRFVQVIIGLFVVYQSIFFIGGGLSLGKGMDIVWFVCLYFIGAYLRLYCDMEKCFCWLKKKWMLSLIIVFLPSIWGLLAGGFTNALVGKSLFVNELWVYNSILVFPSSVVLFIWAFNFRVKTYYERLIIILGKTSFAVYLITDNRNIRSILWDFVREHTSINTFNIIWQFFFTIIVLYLLSSIIDLLRQSFFSRIKTPSFILNRFQNIDKIYNI